MTEIILTTLILLSAFSIRDALIYELSMRVWFRDLSPTLFAVLIASVSAVLILMVLFPLRQLICGTESSPSGRNDVYAAFVSLVIGVCVLILALSIRDATNVWFREHRGDEPASRLTPWIWAATVGGIAGLLIWMTTSLDESLFAQFKA